MTNGRRNGLCAVAVVLLAPLIHGCCFLIGCYDAAPDWHAPDVIPDDVRAALDCDVSARGSGTGAEGGKTKMLPGYRPASRKEGPPIYAFWCARGENNFVLAFVRNGRLTHPDCPSALIWPYAPKAALSISDEPAPLAEFAPVETVNHTAPEPHARLRLSGKTTGSIIVDGDDTLSNQFYCHKGTWLVRMRN
jgi:hypothetical protein